MWTYILFFLISAAYAGKLPQGTVFCNRKNPNLNACLQDAIQKSITHFVPGIPELNIESIDPLIIDKIVIDEKKDQGNPVDIDLVWSDVHITGIKSAVITNAKADWDNGFVSFEADIKDPVQIKGKYFIHGVILVLPINGDGMFEMQLDGFKGHIKVHGKEVEKGGQKYLEVDRLATTFDVGHLAVKYENLFNGDPTMGDSMNQFLNDNWRDILDEMKVTVEAKFSQHFQKIAEKVFHEVPITEIAPA